MTTPNPEQGMASVLRAAHAALVAALDAAVADINTRLVGWSIEAPPTAQILRGESPGVWPEAYPAVRLFQARTRQLAHSGSLGLGNAEHRIVARIYYRAEHGRQSVTDVTDPGPLSDQAWTLADAVRQVLERDLPGTAGIYLVQFEDAAERDFTVPGGDDVHLVKVVETAFAVTQRVRDSFGTAA